MLEHIRRAQCEIKKAGLDSFLFTSSSNLFYLSNFSSSHAYILLLPDKGYYITDSRYYENAKNRIEGLKVIQIKERKLKEILLEILSGNSVKTIGFEKDKVTVSFYEKLREELSEYELKGVVGFLNRVRMTKTALEIDIIQQAVKKTDRIFSQLIRDIDNFPTELSIRRRIVDLIFQEGGSGESFPAIVATSIHSAIPHWETSDSKIEKDAPLLVDMGMKLSGYCSDFTRTLFIGEVNKKLLEIYNVVKEANLEATSVVKVGIPIKEIDLKARSVIDKYGYGEYFTHSTGHGIGIDIHEEPRIYKDNEDVLMENTVFTIEPGIYIPGLGGVRLENVVVATKEGPKILTETSLNVIRI